MRKGLAAFALASLATALSACSGAGSQDEAGTPEPLPVNRTFTASPYPYVYDGSGASVDRSQFGDDWPLTVKSGRVNCVRVGDTAVAVVFTANDGTSYALNGVAKSSRSMETYGFVDVDPIWADNPDVDGAKKDISVLIDVCAPYTE